MKAPEDAIQKLRAARHLKTHAELKPQIDALLKYVEEIETRDKIRPKKMEPPAGMEEKFAIRGPLGLSWDAYQGALDVVKVFVRDYVGKPEVNRLKPVSYIWQGQGLPLYIKCYWGANDVARITISRKQWGKIPIISSMSARSF